MYSCENLEKLLVFNSIQSMVLRMKATAVLCLPEASMAELYENFFSEKIELR